MKYNTATTLITLGALLLIGFSVWYTKNPNCLWALIFVAGLSHYTVYSDDETDS